jgi:hypothetical protein
MRVRPINPQADPRSSAPRLRVVKTIDKIRIIKMGVNLYQYRLS